MIHLARLVANLFDISKTAYAAIVDTLDWRQSPCRLSRLRLLDRGRGCAACLGGFAASAAAAAAVACACWPLTAGRAAAAAAR